MMTDANQTPPAPAISVIVPVHDVQDQVGACIASLRAQRFADFEAIVVDDGSTDASLARARAAIGADPRFRLIEQDNRGLSGARNTGLELARGAFIAFLDGDDCYAPGFLDQMHEALTDSDADWVACGLRNMHADGTSHTHSALHSAPALPLPGGARRTPRLYPLQTWPQVIAHFPSAWNKLYRRALIADLRFDEGTWFEDHAFFCRAAARSTALLHLPEPLYLQTRDRAGQITGADSDRVFEQFAVLDTLAGILLADGSRPGGAAAFAQLAHRLLHERSGALRDPARRARFIAAARDWLAGHGLPGMPGPAQPPSWALEFSGTCPLSVIVPWDGQDSPLRVTLAALARQTQGGAEILIVADDAETAARGVARAQDTGLPQARGLTTSEPGPGPARNAGLAAARGALVVFVDAGDRLMPAALAHWCDTLLRTAADVGISQFRIGLGGAVHLGFHDMDLLDPVPQTTGALQMTPDLALALHCHPSAKIFRRAFLIDQGLRFGSGPLADWPIGIGAALAADKVIYFAWPGAESSEAPDARRLWHMPVSPGVLARTIADFAGHWPAPVRRALPADWPRRLFARALWEKHSFAPMSRPARAWFALQAALVLRRRGWARMTGPLDPYLSPKILRILGADNSPG